MAEIVPFETKQARAERLAKLIHNATIGEAYPGARVPVDGDLKMPEIAQPSLPPKCTVGPLDRTNVDACVPFIQNRAQTVLRHLIEGYGLTYGHEPSEDAKEKLMLIADLVGLIDLQELLNITDHPYYPAFEELIARTKYVRGIK